MKALTILFLATLLSGCMATTGDLKNPFTYEVVNETPATADEIYNASRLWIAETFVSGKAVTQLADAEMDVVIGRGRMDIKTGWMQQTPTDFKIRIDAKDGRYRVAFSDVVMNFGDFGRRAISADDRLAPNTQQAFTQLATELQEYITTSRADADW